MNAHTFLDIAVRPGLGLLPLAMRTDRAEAMLLAIALQESRIHHRRQLHGGPARSYYQFERNGIAGVVTHRASKGMALALCDTLDIEPTTTAVYQAMEFNDHLATGFARLLLWTSPSALPHASDPDYAWAEYLKCWRPGKPHRASWRELYEQAWHVVRLGVDR